MTNAPVLDGETLRLRPHHIDDMPGFWTFFQTPRAKFMDRPATQSDLWFGFASDVGSWALTGMGGWAIETHDAKLAGQVAISKPPHFAETELGWFVLDGFEGRGIAYEAAQLALTYAWDTIRPTSLVSYIDAQNVRSIALAKRLGARLDDGAATHDAADVVYRHRRPQ